MATNKKNDQLTVNVQYIKDLSFESPNSPEALSNKDDTPSINVNINVYAKPLKGNVYEVSLSINLRVKWIMGLRLLIGLLNMVYFINGRD